MDIDVYFDVICPWCFIGQRRLAAALARRPALKPRLHWRPYPLDPDIPEGGSDFRAYAERKFGGRLRCLQLMTAMQEIGRSVGIAFDFPAIGRVPATALAHRLILGTRVPARRDALVRALFEAFFCRGLDIGDPETLVGIAGDCGITARVAGRVLAAGKDDGGRERFPEIKGIPLFVMNRRYAIVGAHEPEVLVRMLDVAAADDATRNA